MKPISQLRKQVSSFIEKVTENVQFCARKSDFAGDTFVI